MFQPDQALRSLILVSWRRADYYVHELFCGLRLGLTGCCPFLTRRALSSPRPSSALPSHSRAPPSNAPFAAPPPLSRPAFAAVRAGGIPAPAG